MATKRYNEYGVHSIAKTKYKYFKWKHNKKAYDGNTTRARHHILYVSNTFRECKNLPTRR